MVRSPLIAVTAVVVGACSGSSGNGTKALTCYAQSSGICATEELTLADQSAGYTCKATLGSWP